MNNLKIAVLTSALTFAFAASAAQAMSADEHKAAKERIASEYKAAKSNCGPLSGNAKDICMADAKGREKVARAELEAQYKPTAKNRSDVNGRISFGADMTVSNLGAGRCAAPPEARGMPAPPAGRAGRLCWWWDGEASAPGCSRRARRRG